LGIAGPDISALKYSQGWPDGPVQTKPYVGNLFASYMVPDTALQLAAAYAHINIASAAFVPRERGETGVGVLQ